MASDLTPEDEAKRRFVDGVDALNLKVQIEGPDPDSATRMRAIIAEHERQCAALTSKKRASHLALGKAQRLGS